MNMSDQEKIERLRGEMNKPRPSPDYRDVYALIRLVNTEVMNEEERECLGRLCREMSNARPAPDFRDIYATLRRIGPGTVARDTHGAPLRSSSPGPLLARIYEGLGGGRHGSDRGGIASVV